MNKIRKGDEVIVMTGRDKGKRGTVASRVDADRPGGRGCQRGQEARQAQPHEGNDGWCVDKTMPIHQSNVAIFNPATGKATGVGITAAG
jgi:large subunit ribosomal protein L24